MENDNSDINIDIEEICAKAIAGDEASLDQLMASVWLAKTLDEITARQGRQFEIDRNEIRDRIYDKLRKKITTIENPKKRSLTKCIRAWCNKVGRRFCLNRRRHREVEDRYVDRVTHENSRGVLKSTKGTVIALQSPSTNSPEIIRLQKEEDLLWANRRADLHSQVYDAVAKLPSEDLNIILLWAKQSTLKEIHQKTGIPIATVQRRLKKSQREILESIGIWKLIAAHPAHEKGANELIGNCMLEMNSLGYFPAHAA